MNNKSFILLVVLAFLCMVANAQSIQVSAPSQVAVGENFRLSYTISTQDVDDFRAGNVPSGLEVIAGPYTSKQSSYQFVNGHTSSSSMITFTYTLYADKAGTYTLPAAHARVGGKTIASRSVRLAVTGSSRRGGGAPQMHEDEARQPSPSSGRISAGDLFVKVSASKRRVHEQEPVLLTYKVYTLVDLTSLDGKMPDLTGFHTQEVPLPQQKSFHLEKLNGKNYRCVTWSQYVMFPQMTGKLTVPSITFKGIVVQQNRSVDPFEAFFNGGSGYVEVKRDIVAPSIDIQVDPLPSKPAGFSGGVGKFNISAQLNHSTVKEGDPLTLRIVVGGIGNLKLIKQPQVEFPKNFEKYDPKVSDKTKLTPNGIEGNMIYDYLVVPRNQGEYTIPAVSLVYYDTSTESYRTIKTQPVSVKVEKGDGSSSSVSDYSDIKNSDILPLKEGKDYDVAGDMLFGSASYWMMLGMALAVFGVVVAVYRKRAADNADIVGTKGKRANKVATKRLKKAYKLMLGGKQGDFYDEVLRALWGYVSDRLNMPVEKLSREMIEGTLSERGIMADTISKFITALDECEFERYAPGDPAGNMSKTYESAKVAIMDIENSLKTSKSSHSASAMRLFVLMLIAMLGMPGVSAMAITKANADAEYAKGNYQQAVVDYEELLKNGESADLYYNLGNSYYRLGNVTRAVISYERACRISPSDDEARRNLEFVRSKTIDKIIPVDEMFFSSWYKSIIDTFGSDGWARMAVAAFVASLLMALLFLLGGREWMRKTGFYAGIVCAVVFVVSHVFAWQQKCAFNNRDRAVVTAPTVSIKATPSATSSDVYVIHEGTGVVITDRTMSKWYSVKLDNGKEGWVLRSQVEVI